MNSLIIFHKYIKNISTSLSLLAFIALAPLLSFAQSAPIAIDGVFDDWTNSLAKVIDPQESVGNIDLLEMSVTNDAEWLYIKIKTDAEIDLSDDLIDHDIRLYIDTDNNASTGTAVQANYGAELALFFSDRDVNFEGNTRLNFNDLSMRSAPTVTSNEFEIALRRDVKPDGSKSLFSGNTIKILFTNASNNDRLPNTGEVFSYTFSETPVAVKTPTDINKASEKLIRIVAYNTLRDGLTNSSQQPHLKAIIQSLNPDIIGFSECNTVTAEETRTLMNNWLPTGNPAGWYVEKHGSHGLITASRWPIKDRWQLERQFPVLIDLPEEYTTDILFTNAHLKCCTGEDQRQGQADEYIAFLKDAKTEGGDIDLPQNTPFVYGGDLNLVGYAQQLKTLVTGDVQNTAIYGSPAAPDWDNTAATDLISLQTENRLDFTWKSESSSFPSGKLDFMIYSDAVVSVDKSFVLRTEIMPANRLLQYSLESTNSQGASDHYPVIADFIVKQKTNEVRKITAPKSFGIYPNPAQDVLNIYFTKIDKYQVILLDNQGKILQNLEANTQKTILNISELPAGVYTLKVISTDHTVEVMKWFKQ